MFFTTKITKTYLLKYTGDTTESNWNHIASLSGSDFDLAAHGDHQDIRDIGKHVVGEVVDEPPPAHV